MTRITYELIIELVTMHFNELFNEAITATDAGNYDEFMDTFMPELYQDPGDSFILYFERNYNYSDIDIRTTLKIIDYLQEESQYDYGDGIPTNPGDLLHRFAFDYIHCGNIPDDCEERFNARNDGNETDCEDDE